VLDGEETVEGRGCYVLSFTPVDPTRTLYRGRVWIDKTSYARVRVSSIQTNVEPPFLSNEERTTYKPATGPDGGDDWVISRIDGQQIYSTGGRNFIVLRDIVFSNHRINDAEFDTVRQPQAWLYRTVHNLALNHLRAGRKIVPLLAEASESIELCDAQPLPDEYLEKMEAIGATRLSLDVLDARSRELIRLKFEEGLSYKEISERTGLSMSNVGYLLHHALKDLAETLKKAGVMS